MSSSTKYDVSYLSADNSVHHIPPNRIERNPASLEVWAGLGRLCGRTRRTGAATLEDRDTAAALDGCRRENGARVRERAA